ncbi:MAG: DUF4160 domain-containing protein [Planctomycetes bacterium]|nr:DUF4160 domain-containing protein [Planctomycetota bacterium]
MIRPKKPARACSHGTERVAVTRAEARFWLDPVSLAASSRFGGRELRRLEEQVIEHRRELLEAWHDYFRP